jgi:sugar/nucleoside kinase (ribokinase family)
MMPLSALSQKILCVGSSLIDIKVFSDEPLEKDSYQKGNIRIVPGGVAYCMSVNFARLGFEASLCSVWGDDMFGAYLEKRLTTHRVDTGLCRIVPGAETAVFSVCADTDDSAYCVYDSAIFEHIRIDDGIGAYLQKNGGQTLVLDSNIPDAELEKLYALKKENGLFIFQNATSPGLALKSRPYISYIDLFGCNEFEAEAISGEKAFPDYTTARRFSKIGYHAFIITFGKKGVLVSVGDEVWIEKALEPEKVVDTIGAGDAFASGFLFGYLNGKAVKECIRIGLICAKETVQTVEDTSDTLNITLF